MPFAAPRSATAARSTASRSRSSSFSALAHIATDYLLYGFADVFFYLAALRTSVAVVLFLVFPLTASSRSITRVDTGIFALQIYLITAFYSAFLIVPPEYLYERVTVQSITALLLLIGQYLFISNRLPYVTVAGGACSLFYFAVTIATDRLHGTAFGLEAVVHVVANVLGVYTVYRAGILRRRQFALSLAQAELNRRLEEQARQLEAQAQELLRTRDDALQANRAKSEFLAYMSHELRSPMNAIIGFSEMMKREVFGRVSPPKYREYADDIHGSATHLLSLINDILDLSKAEAGKLQLNESEVDLGVAIEAVRRLVAVRAEASHVALRTHLAPNLPPLAGDERMVKQMVLNLVSNAIKFTPARGSVTLIAGRDDAGGVFIAIADTGPGIAADDIPRILEAYGRTDSAERAAIEGTGLGLPLVKTMIELHGGTLEIESRPGTGSTFTLRFPPERAALAKAA
jgi:signal transduction histidine kinase